VTTQRLVRTAMVLAVTSALRGFTPTGAIAEA
jgi:hypothetical protein